MEPYSENAATQYPLDQANHWLQKCQGLGLPALPPTTPEARQYFFSKIWEYAESVSSNGKSNINFEVFAQEWNRSANGKERFYVTAEVLATYAKTWEKSRSLPCPGYSVWNPCGIHGIHQEFHMESME